jgi:hypothetical protein
VRYKIGKQFGTVRCSLCCFLSFGVADVPLLQADVGINTEQISIVSMFLYQILFFSDRF